MAETRDIGQYIAEHFLDEEDGVVIHPVLMEWLAASKSNQSAFEQYKKIWMETRNAAEMEEFDAHLAWEKINEKNQQKYILHNRLKNAGYIISGIAASVLLFITLFHFGVFEKSSPDTVVSMVTDYGSRSEIALPDGTHIKLNAGSHISYTNNPKKKIREVTFEGEAFFNVAKSKTPFIITTADGLEVKVLGTSFNLSAYAEDETVRASLVEGHIELTDSGKKLLLSPGEMGVYNKAEKELKKTDGILAHSYGWLNNKLYMNNMSLLEVCRNLERWYGLEISIQNELGEKIHYTGVLKEESVTDALNALCRLSKISYQIKGKKITIKSK